MDSCPRENLWWMIMVHIRMHLDIALLWSHQEGVYHPPMSLHPIARLSRLWLFFFHSTITIYLYCFHQSLIFYSQYKFTVILIQSRPIFFQHIASADAICYKSMPTMFIDPFTFRAKYSRHSFKLRGSSTVQQQGFDTPMQQISLV